MEHLDPSQLNQLRLLAGMQGEQVTVRDDDILISDGTPGYGGIRFAKSEEGLFDALVQYSYNTLNPLDSNTQR